MTNREWINSLSDEELAEMIFYANDFCNQYNLSCPSNGNCFSSCIKEWLKEEHENVCGTKY